MYFDGWLYLGGAVAYAVRIAYVAKRKHYNPVDIIVVALLWPIGAVSAFWDEIDDDSGNTEVVNKPIEKAPPMVSAEDVPLPCFNMAPDDGLHCALAGGHKPPCSSIGPYRNTWSKIWEAVNKVRGTDRLIVANLTLDEQTKFFSARIPWSIATPADATIESHGRHAPYIATTLSKAPEVLAALKWVTYSIEDRLDSWVARNHGD